jgi:hypothetical protein
MSRLTPDDLEPGQEACKLGEEITLEAELKVGEGDRAYSNTRCTRGQMLLEHQRCA